MTATADSSAGYAGRVSEVTWAQLAQYAGASYAVANDADLKLTIGGGGLDRGMTVAAGKAFGRGVYDTWGSATVLSAASVGSGVRWDTLVITRTWGVSGRTSVLTINQGTSAQQPTIVNNTPGTIDDQPLWLFKVTAGSTAISNLIDLRAFPSKIVSFATAAALPATPRLGAQALALDTGFRWVAELVAGVATWQNLDSPNLVNWTSTNGLAGGAGSLIPFDTPLAFGRVHGYGVLSGSVQRAAGLGALVAATGADTTIGVLPVGYRPSNVRRFTCPGGSPGFFSRVSVFADGTVNATPNGLNAVPWLALDACRWPLA